MEMVRALWIGEYNELFMILWGVIGKLYAFYSCYQIPIHNTQLSLFVCYDYKIMSQKLPFVRKFTTIGTGVGNQLTTGNYRPTNRAHTLPLIAYSLYY